ncbi:hypothetical protein NHH03_14175 [Stieleria sp. TO1_6]|uniref:hypothetical protein n=1 Tax=Stieleria tagensis TaxID=2956795 RepID=UPI00209B7918|nr:hypothetical protein [Stieleria tagensis]MCO8122891.1 hypothetical protein [Stieleria tagensis]
MANAARAFEQHRSPSPLSPRSIGPVKEDDPPYSRVQANEMPPPMFQLRMSDGRWIALAYHDIRQIDCRDAGHLQISLLSATQVTVTIEGRNLRDLASLFALSVVRWVRERDPRSLPRPEQEAEIIRISIETNAAE